MANTKTAPAAATTINSIAYCRTFTFITPKINVAPTAHTAEETRQYIIVEGD